MLTSRSSVNDIFYWYPLIKNVDVPMPRTILIEYMGNSLERDSPEWRDFILGVQAITDSFGYPVFIRGGDMSAKHEWKDSCYLDDPKKLSSQAHNILVSHLMVMGIRMDFTGIAVREFLELQSAFKAFGGEMPIAREFRFFWKDGEYQCHHPYWPPSSIWYASEDGWYGMLREMQILWTYELDELKRYGDRIAEALDAGPLGYGHWSMDFCKTVDGTWYLTDLATGLESYHWGTCSNAPEDMKKYPDPENEEKIAENPGPTGRAERYKTRFGRLLGDKE